MNFFKLPTKIIDRARRLLSSMPSNNAIAPIKNFLLNEYARPAGRQANKPGPVVAAEGVEDPLYYGLLAMLAAEIKQICGGHSDLLLTRSISGSIGTGWVNRVKRSQLIGWLTSSQWWRANKGIIDHIGYRSQSFDRPFDDLTDLFRAFFVWRKYRSEKGANFSKLEIDNILVGDLIIDSYLRFRPSPQFDITDGLALQIVWQAHRDVRRARHYFSRHRPSLYLTTYATYLEHGIAARAAINVGTTVLSFGNLTKFGKPLTAEHGFHTPDTSKYRTLFEKLEDQESCLEKARQLLEFRLSGGIDEATSYMKASAYAACEAAIPDVQGSVVIFLHDFYDSPHVYDKLIFEDFWEWICFTIETLVSSGTKFYVKPHPNQISLSDIAFAKLREKYPDIRVLPSGTSNAQLAKAGITCGISAYGTVIHELAYMGIPTIACANHPHYVFDFCRTARTVEEYRSYLFDPGFSALSLEEMRRQALIFVYMHNFHSDGNDLALRSQFSALWKAAHRAEATGNDIVDQLRQLKNLPEFRSFVGNVATQISNYGKEDVQNIDN